MNFGTDLSLLENDFTIINAELATVSDVENLQQAIYLRLICDKGELVYHPDHGTDLFKHIGKALTTDRVGKIKGIAKEAAEKDPRVEKVIDVSVERNNKVLLVGLSLKVVDVDQPVNLVFPFKEGWADVGI